MVSTQSLTINDKILKRLEDMELRFSEHGKAKLSYTSICNEPIHPSVPTKTFPHKFEIPKIDKFIGKEDHRENFM